ncbi:MAG: dethiobiotin synthase [Lentisphaerota bacterium]
MNSFFITGTDTGVGKTLFTSLLLAEARRRGIDAAPMKPVQTGCLRQGSELVAPDLEQCLAMAGLAPGALEKSWMCPYPFEPACSPHLAARLSGSEVRIEKILENYARLKSRHAAILVEGAGGVLVPLGSETLMLDLMKALALPVILAARAGLGTINHTLLSLRELRRADVEVFGVVLISACKEPRQALLDDNAATIERLGETRILARVPFFQSLESCCTAGPIIGKLPPDFSNDWKIPDLFFSPSPNRQLAIGNRKFTHPTPP